MDGTCLAEMLAFKFTCLGTFSKSSVDLQSHKVDNQGVECEEKAGGDIRMFFM